MWKLKVTEILSWIQILVNTLAFILITTTFFRDDWVNEIGIVVAYTLGVTTVPVHLLQDALYVKHLIPEFRSFLILYLTLSLLLITCITTLIFVVKLSLLGNSKCGLYSWTLFGVMGFVVSMGEVAMGDYLNGVSTMLVFVLAMSLVYREETLQPEEEAIQMDVV